jgi:ribosomal protein S18 acetylase RimI-like enzyme
MPLRFRVREGELADLGVIEEMLEAALNWDSSAPRRSLAELYAVDATVPRYLAEWGRAGDASVIAVASSGYCIGAAWYRLFSAEQPGFGFVDASTPELSIAVARPYRGRGVGSALLAALLAAAAERGHPRLSLTVAIGNPAQRLYRRHGFVDVATRKADLLMVAPTVVVGAR